jgi:hypothetical protein
MSLTTFLSNSDVRKRFAEEFKREPVIRKYKPLAPPLSSHYGLVGTAFDYLLRFYLKRLNTSAIVSPWVAEKVPSMFEDKIQNAIDNYTISRWIPLGRYYRPDKMLAIIRYRQKRYKKVYHILTEAKDAYANYLRFGKMDQQILKSALLLAQLDPFYRSGQDEFDLGKIDKHDIKDLEALIKLVSPNIFKAKRLCILNPTFGTASRIVGGADADIILDNTIIEVKTTKHLQVRRENWNQLIGYYILASIGGIDHISPNYKIKRLGIYFARYGELLCFEIKDTINHKKLNKFIRWFITRALKE